MVILRGRLAGDVSMVVIAMRVVVVVRVFMVVRMFMTVMVMMFRVGVEMIGVERLAVFGVHGFAMRAIRRRMLDTGLAVIRLRRLRGIAAGVLHNFALDLLAMAAAA